MTTYALRAAAVKKQGLLKFCYMRYFSGECAVRMARAGADVVGANCLFDPFINLTVLKMMKERLDKENLSPFLMSQVSFLYNDLNKDAYTATRIYDPRWRTIWMVQSE